MYILKRTHKLKSGEVRVGYGLMECRRVGGAPKQKTVLNLGADFDVDRSDWAALCDRVVDVLRGRPPLPMEDAHVRETADAIVVRLKRSGYDVGAPLDDRDAVITDEIHHEQVRTVGGERVGLKALEQLGFMALLRRLGLSERHVRLAAALVIGRMTAPGSEAAAYDWMTQRSAILELLKTETPGQRSLYRVGDKLYAHREAIMDGLFDRAKTLFGFEEAFLFYDLTNVYFTGRQQGDLLAFGRSKDKRNNCPLVTLALSLDASGFPMRAEILPGNASEPSTLKSALSHLNGRKPTVIMDAGIATKANLAYLRAQELGWICVERARKPPAPTSTPDDTLVTRAGSVVKAWALSNKDGEQRVYLQSEARKYTGDSILEKQRKRYEKALDELHEGLSKPGHLKNYNKVLVKIGRLKERHKRVAHQYSVKVEKKKKGKNAASVAYTHTLSHDVGTQSSGGYVLRTSHTDWSVGEAALTYWRLTDIERTFRTMKSELGLRPVFHRNKKRIEAHLFISVLAYHAVHVIRLQLKARGVHDGWSTLQFILNQWQRITTVLPQGKDKCIRLTKDADLHRRQRHIAAVMGINPTGFACKTKGPRPTKV